MMGRSMKVPAFRYQCVNVWVTWKVQNFDRFQDLKEEAQFEQLQQFKDQFEAVSTQELIYSMSHLILVFWCPAFIVVCSYAVIVTRFRKKIRKTRSDTKRQQRTASIEQFKAKAVKLHYRLDAPPSAVVLSPSTSAESLKSDSGCSAGRLTDVPIVITAPEIFVNATGAISNNVAIQTLSRVKRRTVRASACISFAYVACWSPYNILELWRFLDPTLENRYLELLSNLIVLNAVLNPLIYR